MHMKAKIALLVVMVLAFLPTASNAYACDGGHDTHGVAAASFTLGHRHHHHVFGLVRASATYLGLTADQLKSQLRSGKTLAEVANATPGKSDAGLVDYLTGLAKAKLDRWVSAGKLSAAKEAAILSRIHLKLERVVDLHWSAFRMHH